MNGEQPVRFLIVDDLEQNLLVLEALLRREGLEILKARSGREALELLLVHDVALALIDVQMPEMDGFELAELMRGTQRTSHVPIIFVTAGASEPNRVFRGYDAGAVDFLVKPIDSRILRHKTETFFQLHKQQQALAETLRLNEELMAVVGHDLRNPLNVILMTATLLEGQSTDPATQKAVRRLKSSSVRMVQIIDELFDLTRARLGGGIPIERKPANALVIAKTAVAEFEATEPSRKFQLFHDDELRGDWDPSRIEQVVSNLIGNAVRHGSKTDPIVVEVRDRGTNVLISIHNGGQIPAELIPKLFDPFQSGPGQRTRAQGLGLGLYIVQQIVLAHGGTVDVESHAETGTTFSVLLPRSRQIGTDDPVSELRTRPQP